MVKVFFKKIDLTTTTQDVQEFSKELLDAVVKEEKLKLEKNIPLKVHFGEKGNQTYIKPEKFLGVVEWLKEKNIESSYMETNTIYGGQRNNKEVHVKLALEHGFTQLPIIIADGESGENYEHIEINKQHFDKCKIGKAFSPHKQIIVLTHFKGHRMAGFGGAIKNLAMGFGTKGGKLEMHMGIKPRIINRKCVACNACVPRCNVDALNINKDSRSYIDHDKCVGCGACVPACPHKAITIFSLKGLTNFLTKGALFKEKMTEYAYAAQLDKQFIYINFAMDITKGCDCEPRKMKPTMPDMGLFISTDPVAIDKACFDMAEEQGNKFKGGQVFKHAQEIGFGTTEYELVKL